MQTRNVEGATSKPGKIFYDALLLDARLRQSLVALRSPGMRNIRIAALETIDSSPVPAFSSRWCRQKITCSASEGTEEYLRFLEQVLDDIGARVLITSSDGTVALMRQHRERLERHVRIALAKEPALGIAINKAQTLEVARTLGIAVPRGVNVGAVNEIAGALHEIGLPAVIKPLESWVSGGQKGSRFTAELVTTAEEAHYVVERMTHLGGTVLFQKFLSGRREAVNFLYAHNQVYARFAQWARRTYPPLGGSSVLRQSIAVPPDIGKQAEILVREINLEGYSEVEFRRDSAGKPYLMEINPRLSASVELAVSAGVDFPYMLYQWANGDRMNVVQGYRSGIWMRYLGGDLLSTAAAVLERGRPGIPPSARAISDFCTSFLLPMKYDYVNWEDPLPALAATAGYLRHMTHLIDIHVLRKLLRKEP